MAANNPGKVGPYSRWLRRGSLGTTDGNTTAGRFLRATEAALIEHVGGAPSVAERILIARLSRILLRLHLLDEKFAAGKGTDLDTKITGGLDSALRNGLKALGMKGAAARPGDVLKAHLAALAQRPPSEDAA